MPGSRWNFHACLQTHGSGLQTYGKTRWFANERKMFAKQGPFPPYLSTKYEFKLQFVRKIQNRLFWLKISEWSFLTLTVF